MLVEGSLKKEGLRVGDKNKKTKEVKGHREIEQRGIIIKGRKRRGGWERFQK